jgi:hypothetical protein
MSQTVNLYKKLYPFFLLKLSVYGTGEAFSLRIHSRHRSIFLKTTYLYIPIFIYHDGKVYKILLLSLAPQPSVDLGLLHKMRLNFLEASEKFSFLQGRVVSPTPNPHPRMGYGGTILIPRSPHGEYIKLL